MEIPKIDLKKIDKRFIKLGIIILSVFIVFIVGIILARIFITSKLSYEKIEEKMRDEAIKYYNKHTELLPNTDDGEVTLNVQKLIDDGRMKPISKYLKDDSVSCNGKVIVTSNGDNYLYTPYLDCGKDYKTVTLTETLIDSSNIVSSGDGLYNMGDYYLYRGEYVNNYIKFAGQTWRILRINNDGTIRILQTENVTYDDQKEFVFDNRYNSEAESDVGFNDFNISRLRDTLNDLYDSEMFSQNDKSFMVLKNLCIGARNWDSTDNSGAIECSVQTPEKYALGLIQVNEFLLASIDTGCNAYNDGECTNYNYLANIRGTSWTMTPCITYRVRTYKQFYMNRVISYTDTYNYKGIKLVTNISSHALYESGDGSEANPYVIKYNNEK